MRSPLRKGLRAVPSDRNKPMTQSAADRPDPTILRKAAIVAGGVSDHKGRVRIEHLKGFDLNRTIFQTLKGTLPRFLMKWRVARDVHWPADESTSIANAYAKVRTEVALPDVSRELIEFLIAECDFDVEHAEGSFLDHLYFGFEYCVQHYPQYSPMVMLLHSILGTGTNTFAMEAAKIPQLKALITDFEFCHVEAFPSVLRLLYVGDLIDELAAETGEAKSVQSVRFHRVIDNEPITMSGDDLWIQLNYQLMHLIDFLPAANWVAHQNDTSFILFRELHELMQKAHQLHAQVGYEPATGPRELTGEPADLATQIITRVPVGVIRKKSAQSIQSFSDRIGHSLDFEITWA